MDNKTTAPMPVKSWGAWPKPAVRPLHALDGADGANTLISGFKGRNFRLEVDGKGVDARDAAFGQVRLWQDLNQDGVSQSNELVTLAARNIASIALTPSTSTTNLGNGNTVTGQATVTRTTGSSTVVDSVDLQASNLNLAANPFYRPLRQTVGKAIAN